MKEEASSWNNNSLHYVMNLLLVSLLLWARVSGCTYIKLFEADIVMHIHIFLVYHLSFSVSPYVVSPSFPVARVHFTFYFILPGVQDIGPGRISTP